MPSMYRVQQGDYVSRIAAQFGFSDYQAVWNDPQNASLKQKRKNPNVLLPGDMLFIPEKKSRLEARATGAMHTFQVKRSLVQLRLVLRDSDGQPIPDLPCRLQVDKALYSLTTDGEGKIEQEIPLTAIEAKLLVQGEAVPVKIGYLDPVEVKSGQRARLNNLGYDSGTDAADEDSLRYAIEEFQCDQELTVDGVCGPETQARLKEIHGC